MSWLEKILKRGDFENSDYEKIEVSTSGDFSMSAENIFDNEEESLLLLHKMKDAVASYVSQQSKAS